MAKSMAYYALKYALCELAFSEKILLHYSTDKKAF